MALLNFSLECPVQAHMGPKRLISRACIDIHFVTLVKMPSIVSGHSRWGELGIAHVRILQPLISSQVESI